MPALQKHAGSSLTKCEPAPPAKAVQQVLTWIVEGFSEQDILEAIAEQMPDQPAPALLTGAWTKISESAHAPQDAVVAWAMEATRHVYSKMVELGDFAGAMRAIKQVVDLAERRSGQQPEAGGD